MDKDYLVGPTQYKRTIVSTAVLAAAFGFVFSTMLEKFEKPEPPKTAAAVVLAPAERLVAARNIIGQAQSEAFHDLTDSERVQNTRIVNSLDEERVQTLVKGLPGWVTNRFYNFEFDPSKRAVGGRPLSWGTASYKGRSYHWFASVDATDTLSMELSSPIEGFTPPVYTNKKWKDDYCLLPERLVCDSGGAFEDLVLEKAPLQLKGLRFKIEGRFPAPPSY